MYHDTNGENYKKENPPRTDDGSLRFMESAVNLAVDSNDDVRGESCGVHRNTWETI